MVRPRRACAAPRVDGQACQMAPLIDGRYCFAHDPERAADAAEARRLGGVRRRREGTIAVAYDFEGLDRMEGIRRLLVIASTDVLGFEPSFNRSRVLIAVAAAAAKLLETGELAERIATLEAAAVAPAGDDHDAFPGG